MAGSMADYMERNFLNSAVGGAAFVTPSTWYVALFTTSPDDSGGNGVEVTGGSYARQAVANNTTNWPALTAGTPGVPQTNAKTNAVAIGFPTATANWGTLVGVALLDAASSGNMGFWMDLASSVTINTGGTFRFEVGALSIGAD